MSEIVLTDWESLRKRNLLWFNPFLALQIPWKTNYRAFLDEYLKSIKKAKRINLIEACTIESLLEILENSREFSPENDWYIDWILLPDLVCSKKSKKNKARLLAEWTKADNFSKNIISDLVKLLQASYSDRVIGILTHKWKDFKNVNLWELSVDLVAKTDISIFFENFTPWKNSESFEKSSKWFIDWLKKVIASFPERW